jgi:hypothetical protein
MVEIAVFIASEVTCWFWADRLEHDLEAALEIEPQPHLLVRRRAKWQARPPASASSIRPIRIRYERRFVTRKSATD